MNQPKLSELTYLVLTFWSYNSPTFFTVCKTCKTVYLDVCGLLHNRLLVCSVKLLTGFSHHKQNDIHLHRIVAKIHSFFGY